MAAEAGQGPSSTQQRAADGRALGTEWHCCGLLAIVSQPAAQHCSTLRAGSSGTVNPQEEWHAPARPQPPEETAYTVGPERHSGRSPRKCSGRLPGTRDHGGSDAKAKEGLHTQAETPYPGTAPGILCPTSSTATHPSSTVPPQVTPCPCTRTISTRIQPIHQLLPQQQQICLQWRLY